MDYYSHARAVDCFDNDIPGRIKSGMRMVGVVEKIPLNIIQSENSIKVEYNGNEHIFDSQKASLNSLRAFIAFKRDFDVEKAPSAFKDWNDVVLNKPSSTIQTKSKYERDENLQEKRIRRLKM